MTCKGVDREDEECLVLSSSATFVDECHLSFAKPRTFDIASDGKTYPRLWSVLRTKHRLTTHIYPLLHAASYILARGFIAGPKDTFATLPLFEHYLLKFRKSPNYITDS